MVAERCHQQAPLVKRHMLCVNGVAAPKQHLASDALKDNLLLGF
jgi:hypothetical protein